MVLYLGLGTAVIIAIIVAVFVLRSARSRDRDEDNGMERDPRSRDEDWSIDDYRSAHPIRGKYATPSGGRGPAGPGGAGPGDPRRARGYQSGGYQGDQGLAADQYDRAAAGGYGQAQGQAAYNSAPVGYGPPQTAGRDDWQRPGAGYGPGDEADPAYPDAPHPEEEPPAEGKKKGRGKRFRIGHRTGEEDIWPDDGVSDEDYWASVSTERGLPSTDQSRPGGGSPFPPAGRSASARPTTMDARAVDPRAPMATPTTGPRQQSAPRPAAGLAQPPAASASTPGGGFGAPGGPGMPGGGPAGPGPSQRQAPGAPGRYAGRDQDPRNTPDGRGGPGWGAAPRPEPNGYPDPRDLRPSARPPSRHAGGAPAGAPPVPPDRYQAALSEQTETFSMPPEVSPPQAPTAQYPSPARGSGRHSRPREERGRAPHPYGQQPEDDPYDPAYRRDRRLDPVFPAS